ncbi:phospholipase, partial [Serratia marcescens]
MSMPLSFTSAVSPVAAIPTPRAIAETAPAAQPAAAPASP